MSDDEQDAAPKVEAWMINKIKIEQAARQKGDQMEAEMLVHKAKREALKLQEVEALEEARLVGLAHKEDMRERARQLARDNESDKQKKKRESRELAEAHEFLRLEEEAAKKALHDKRMEALMDPNRDPSMPLPLDPKEGAMMTKEERKQLYIDNQIFALTASENQIMELENNITETRLAENLARVEADQSHREANKVKVEAEHQLKLCVVDRNNKHREYKKIEGDVKKKTTEHNELVGTLTELHAKQTRALQIAVSERGQMNETHKLELKKVVAAVHGDGDVTKDKERMARMNAVARIDKQLRKMRSELKGDLDRFKHCNKTSARKAEFKQVYEENLVKINEMNVKMQEAVNADNALDEERRQQGVDRMEKAAELLGKLREVELVAKTALEETTAKLAFMETDLTGAAAKATVDMHIADSERLRAVQAEGQSNVALSRAKRLFKHASLQQRHMEHSARRVREMTDELAQRKSDYMRLSVAFERITGKKYKVSRARAAEIKASAEKMKTALKAQKVVEKKPEWIAKPELVQAEVVPVPESSAKWCGYSEDDPAMNTDGRLGVKEPPDSASQTIAFVAGKIKQAELLAIAAQKAEIERLEVERKEGLIAARKLEAAKAEQYKEDKRAAQLALREKRIKQVQIDRLKQREWERQRAERERKEELEKRYQAKRALAQALQEEKLRRRGLLGSIKNKSSVRPWRPGTTNSLLARQTSRLQIDPPKAVETIEENAFPSPPASPSSIGSPIGRGEWWPHGDPEALSARCRSTAHMDMKRSIMKKDAVSSAMAAIVEREGENLCRHLGTTRPHTVMGMTQERSPGDAYANVWRPKHVLTPLVGGSSYGRLPNHSLGGIGHLSP